jgi:hypothetical protein
VAVPSPAGSVTTDFRRQDVNGQLTDRTWRDPKTGTMLWMLAAIVALPPIAIVATVVLAYVVWRTW